MEDDANVWFVAFDDQLADRSFLGLKVAVQTDATDLTAALTAEGALPVVIPFPELFAALQTGIIDAAGFEDRETAAFLAAQSNLLSLYGFTATPSGISGGGEDTADDPNPTDGPDVLTGTVDADDLEGLGGDDRIEGGRGNDTIDGGAGVDAAVYTGAQSAYSVTLTASGVEVMDRRSVGDGTDFLTNTELLDFAGAEFDLRTFGGATSLEAAAFESFVELYIAYFNRAPDAIGLGFWGTAFANGTSLSEMAALFVDQDETRATYPEDSTVLEFVETVYLNVLGRLPDSGGVVFWTGVLDSGSVSRDQFILEVLGGARAAPPADADQAFIDQQAADRAYLAEKTDLGVYFAVTRGMSDVENARSAMSFYDGTDTGFQNAVAAIDSFYGAALDPVTGAFLMQIEGVVSDPILIGASPAADEMS